MPIFLRKIFSFFLIPVSFTLFVLPCAALASGLLRADFDLNAGIRVDNFDWNIAGTSAGTGPNILSELTWTDLKTFQIKGVTRLYISRWVYARGTLQGGWILSGDNQDSDFSGDNRTLESSRSNNGAGDGNLWDTSGGIGFRYAFGLMNSRVEIIPLVGYSYHRQNLTITDGFQTIPLTGPFSGLDSTYRARWRGPWFGVDLSFTIEDLILNGSFEYHLAEYRAEADWNLRSDFQHPVSFLHTADGSGVAVSGSASYPLSPAGLFVKTSLEYQDWQTDPGVDKTFFANGTVSETRLNAVNWNSFSFMFGLLYSF